MGRDLAWIAVIGVAAGTALALVFARVLENLVYGVSVHDVATFVAAPALLALAVAAATIAPTRRAMRVNPADVMRSE